MTLPPDDNGPDEINNLPGDDVDPMKWLESLAARQGANPEEFITSADMDVPEADPNAVIDEPGYVDYDPFGSSKREKPAREAHLEPAPEPAPPQQEPATVAPAAMSAYDDVDPLAWLESLAKRQGADPQEFVTEANLEIAEVDPDTVIDEPGYTPYDGIAPKPAASTPPPARAPEPVKPEPQPESLEEDELTAAEAAALLGVDVDQLVPVMEAEVEEVEAILEAEPEEAPPAMAEAKPGDPTAGEVDPLAWLESLAKRQGARSEELITAADLDVPEAAADAVVDEPGYVDYSPFGATAEAEEVAEELEAVASEPPMPAEILEEADIPSGDATLAWLEGLAREQSEELADPLAGLSDEEIEQKAAAGELSADQMEAWLSRQAASLAQARVDTSVAFEDEALEPAQPAEIPSWLQEAMPEEAPAGEPAPLIEDIMPPPEPADLPDWLAEPEPEEAPAAFAALVGEEEQIDTEDKWAQALDEEYVTQRMEIQEEPEWYRANLEDPARQAAVDAEASAVEETLEAEELPEPEPAELPDWLVEATEKAAEAAPDWLEEQPVPDAEGVAEPVDDWLSEAELEQEIAPEDMPDWLLEPVSEVEVPDWLAEAAPEPPAEPAEAEPAAAPAVSEPKPARATAPATVVAPLSAAVPAGAAYDTYRTSLTANPQDHETRLDLARKLIEDNQVLESVGQYEVLASAAAMLDDIEDDLNQIVESRPNLPQARRVLGDVFMRKGRLQDALDAYRTALEQL